MSRAAALRVADSPRPDVGSGEDLYIQYSAGSRYPAALEPEIRLMAMILEDAVVCFQRFAGARSNPGLKEFRDAERWLFSDVEDWIFSFQNICACLGLEPRYIRSGLRRWQRERQDRPLERKGRHRSSRRAPVRGPMTSPKIQLLR